MYRNNEHQWTMTRHGNRGDDYYTAYRVNSKGFIDMGYVNNNHSIHPVLYLSSDITIGGGNGSSTNPFTAKP